MTEGSPATGSLLFFHENQVYAFGNDAVVEQHMCAEVVASRAVDTANHAHMSYGVWSG